MIDFHSHILPNMDDGADSCRTSLEMLSRSFRQGVDLMVSTSHFYADEEDPDSFLTRRREAFSLLEDAMLMSPDVYPQIRLGAEVLYFPGISEAEDVSRLVIQGTDCILIEPPMAPWTDAMLDEIAAFGRNFRCRPVIAHVDRFMNMLGDKKLIARVLKRDLTVQVNAEYFLNPATCKTALKHLASGQIHLIGSDCHNTDTRSPNLGAAKSVARHNGLIREFNELTRNAEQLLYIKDRL